MSKSQQIDQLLPTFDKDHDGQLTHEQFGGMIIELGYQSIYAGSIKKMIRRMNFENPDKNTLSYQQAKEYAQSSQTKPRHDIWKQKYQLLEWSSEIKRNVNRDPEQKEDAAAPGKTALAKWQEDTSVQEGEIKVLVGQHQPSYLSQVILSAEKNDSGPKVKPFIKLNFLYKEPNKAKQMQVLFKQTFQKILKLIGQDAEDWAPQMDNFHINSFVSGNSVTFFLTTVNQQLVSLLQLGSQTFELCFGSSSSGKAHFKFEFDYDFNKFLTNTESNFYEVFTNAARLNMNTSGQHFLKAFRRMFMIQNSDMGSDFFQNLFPIAIFHMDSVEADIEIDSLGSEYPCETESRQEVLEGLKELVAVWKQMEEKGVNVRGMLELLDAEVTIDASVGEWKGQAKLRLHNIDKLLLKAYSDFKEEDDNEPKPCKQNKSPDIIQLHSSDKGSDISLEEIKPEKKKSQIKKAQQKSESSSFSDEE